MSNVTISIIIILSVSLLYFIVLYITSKAKKDDKWFYSHSESTLKVHKPIEDNGISKVILAVDQYKQNEAKQRVIEFFNEVTNKRFDNVDKELDYWDNYVNTKLKSFTQEQVDYLQELSNKYKKNIL